MFDIKKFIHLNQKEKIRAYVVAGVIAVFLFQKIAFSGIFNKIHKLDGEIKKQEAELLIAMSVEKRKGSIETDDKTYGAYLPAGNISDVVAVTNFLREVEDIARRSGVSIVNLSPENQGKEAGAYRKYFASLRFESSPESFYKFLYEVQKSKVPVRVEKLAVTTKDENATALRVDATMSMAAF